MENVTGPAIPPQLMALKAESRVGKVACGLPPTRYTPPGRAKQRLTRKVSLPGLISGPKLLALVAQTLI